MFQKPFDKNMLNHCWSPPLSSLSAIVKCVSVMFTLPPDTWMHQLWCWQALEHNDSVNNSQELRRRRQSGGWGLEGSGWQWKRDVLSTFGAKRGHFNSPPVLYGSVFLRIVIGGRSSALDPIWILSSQLLWAAPHSNKKQLGKTGFN